MNQTKDESIFEILGYELRLKPDDGHDDVSAHDVVDLVDREAQKILKQSPHLDRGKVALLVALKLGSDKLAMQKEFQYNMKELQSSARDALQFIEEISPIAH